MKTKGIEIDINKLVHNVIEITETKERYSAKVIELKQRTQQLQFKNTQLQQRIVELERRLNDATLVKKSDW